MMVLSMMNAPAHAQRLQGQSSYCLTFFNHDTSNSTIIMITR